MMRTIVKQIYKFIAPIVIVWVICEILLFHLPVDISKINDNDFIFVFIGLLLGFAITIFPFIVMLVDKIREKAEHRYQSTPDRKKEIEDTISKLYIEIKEDILFIFISLIIIGIIYITQNIDTPYASNKIQKYFEKPLFFKSIRLSIFILNMYAIYDLIKSAFKLSDTTGIIKLQDEKK